MKDFTVAQEALLYSNSKNISWLFNVSAVGVDYYWSTKNVTFDGQAYTFKVIDFNGLTLARPKTEMGIMSPSSLSFTISNRSSLIDPDNLEEGFVTLILIMSDGTNAAIEMMRWKFLIKKAKGAYQSIVIDCEDFYQQFIEGNYPITQFSLSDLNVQWDSEDSIVWDSEDSIEWYAGGSGIDSTDGLKTRDIFPASTGDITDDVCLPMIFGTAYIPLRSVYTDGDRYYVLGPTVSKGVGITYTIDKVRTPRAYSAKSEFDLVTDFVQATKVTVAGQSFRMFQANVSPGEGGTAAFFANGDNFYDLPTQFSRSDTATMTNPADIIQYVLLDMGYAESDIDQDSFDYCHTAYDEWGLEFNGGFWKVVSREQALTYLLSMCHATLLFTDKVYLQILDSASQLTITSEDILKSSETGKGSYSIEKLEKTLSDCGNIQYSPTGDSQDLGVSALVAALDSTKTIDSEERMMMFIADETLSKQMGRLYFQRKLLKKSNEKFTAKSHCLKLQPSDFFTIQGDNYGGTHDLMVDVMFIKKDLAIDFTCIGFKATIENGETGPASMSPSASPSKSPSRSPSISPSTSPSASPSKSPSASPSLSPSASASPSISPSASPSKSPSRSPSISPSASPSVSPSASPSPSPGYMAYTKGNYVSLPSTNGELTTAFTGTNYTDVSSKNDTRVSQNGNPTEYIIQQFKDYAGANSAVDVEWEGQSNKAPSVSTVYLQIWRVSNSTWETIASNSVANANTDFTLTANVASLTNYKDASNVITCRVYQVG